MGAPARHRYCADAVVGYWRKVTLWAPAEIRQNPAGHASLRPWGIETEVRRHGAYTPAQLAILGNIPNHAAAGGEVSRTL
jgi:hypothetical protein